MFSESPPASVKHRGFRSKFISPEFRHTTSYIPQQQWRSEVIRAVVVDSEVVIEEEDRLEGEAEVSSSLRAQLQFPCAREISALTGWVV